MKILFFHFFIFGLFVSSLSLNAQYGFEWINWNQPYIKIKTFHTGLHYLTSEALNNAGMPSNADPRTIRMYRRGIEQNLHIVGEQDGVLNLNDTVFFYGQLNDGALDSDLYKLPAHQAHQYLSLFSDTSVYFLSWGGSASTHRMQTQAPESVSACWFHAEQISSYFHEYYAINPTVSTSGRSEYEIGEGWSSRPFLDAYSFTLKEIQHPALSGFAPKLQFQVAGRSYHHRDIVLKVGDPNAPDFSDTLYGFSWYQMATYEVTLPASVLLKDSIQVTIAPLSTMPFPNYISITYCRLTYPQSFDVPFQNQKVFYIEDNTAPQSVEITSNEVPYMLLDISNQNNVNLLSGSYSGSTLSLSIPAGIDSFLVVNRPGLLTPFEISPVQFTAPDINNSYHILSHPKLKESVLEYANYRSSAEGGNFDVGIHWIQDLYDVFSYGEATPWAIYRFSKYISTNEDARFLFFIGKGLDPAFQRDGKHNRWNQELSISTSSSNLVPTAGSPASDILFVMNEYKLPQLAVGRISATSNSMVTNYLEKVKEHEASPFTSKKLIHLSGGNNLYESNYFAQYVDSTQRIVENSLWQGVVSQRFKKTDFSDLAIIDISEEVNSGVSFINIYGHSSSMVTDPYFGNASIDSNNFHNKGKYPMLVLSGCSSANVFWNTEGFTLMEDWVLTPERGAIIGVGAVDVIYSYSLFNYSVYLYKYLFDKQENIGKPTGEIIRAMLHDHTFITDQLTKQQMLLYGDPAIVVNRDESIVASTAPAMNEGPAISIWPNPSSGTFTVESEINGSIQIVNASGIVLYSDNIQLRKELHLNLKSGLYLLRIADEEKQIWKKIVIR